MNNNIFQFIRMLKSSGNPEQMAKNLLNNNPQARDMLSQVRNSTQGASPEAIAKQLAKQRGIDEAELLEVFKMLNG